MTAAPPSAPPAPAIASPRRLVATLATAGIVAGVLIVVAYQAALPAIRRAKAAKEAAAAREVLHDPARLEPLYEVEGRLVDEVPAGLDADALEKVFVGSDAAGTVVGFALQGSSTGYADAVVLVLGYDPASKRVLGLKVIESRETPGLGDRIQDDPEFRARFPGKEAPMLPVKPGKGTGDPHEVDTISGATISSRAVVRAANSAVQRWEPLLLEWTTARERQR